MLYSVLKFQKNEEVITLKDVEISTVQVDRDTTIWIKKCPGTLEALVVNSLPFSLQGDWYETAIPWDSIVYAAL